MRGDLLLVSVPLACLALAGCSSTGPLQATKPAVHASSQSEPDNKVDEVTRGILMAAGLDPTDPTKPRELRRQVAAVVQVRYRGRTYGTALARPTPGKIAFVDPMAVANLLAGTRSKTELVQALRGPLVDVDSNDCRFDGRAARKVRKAFKLPKVCPPASGSIWADLDRRGMIVELHVAPQLASLIQGGPTETAGLATPTLFASQADTAPAAEPSTDTATPGKPAYGGVNLLAPEVVAAVVQPETPPAAAPISLTAPVVLPPLPSSAKTTVAAAEPSPWSSLLAPTSIGSAAPARETPAPAPTPAEFAAPAAMPAPETRPAPAVVAAADAPGVLSRNLISETDASYVPAAPESSVRVVPDSYRPATATTTFFRTKY